MHFFIFLNFIFSPSIEFRGEPMYFSHIGDKTQIELPQGGDIFAEDFSIKIGYLFSEYDSKGEVYGKGSDGVFFSNSSSSLFGQDLSFDNYTLSISGDVKGSFENVVEFESDSVFLDIEKNNFLFKKIERSPTFLYKDFLMRGNLINLDLTAGSFEGKEDIYFEFHNRSNSFIGNADSFHAGLEENLVYFSNIFLSNGEEYDMKSEYIKINIETMQLESNGSFELVIKND